MLHEMLILIFSGAGHPGIQSAIEDLMRPLTTVSVGRGEQDPRRGLEWAIPIAND